jgi:hypothetical protein
MGNDSNPLDVIAGSDLPAFLDDVDGDMEEQAAIAARMSEQDPEAPAPCAQPESNPSGTTCPGCGSRELCICSTMPVFVYQSAGKIVRVVVPEGYQADAGGVTRCLSCERFWIIDTAAGESWS